MNRTGFATGLLMAAAFAFPAASQAQVLGHGDAYRIGYDKGLADGLKRGAKDRTKGDDRDMIHDPKYRKGDAGYKKSFGPRQDYITGYRDGYEQAYRRGYRTGDEARQRDHDGRAYPAARDDPYGYGRDDRWGRDRDDRGREERDDPYGRDNDYDEDVVYEEPPGRR